ncbi:MAG TPA: response regulator [Candidatus Binatia bacterium]|nr:response regulator [Candidatus Binatia bacterium]
MKQQKTGKRERVLVVDDAREIREFLTEYILEPQGFEVLTASDGLEGLQLAFSEQPDLLIVDVQMPNMSGLELLRRLRLRRVDIPAILVTAHGTEQIAVKALRLGVRDYVIKPFVVEEMKGAIDRAMRESRLQLERDQLVEQLKASNARLRRRAQELNVLYSIGKSVSSSLDLDVVLQRIVEAAIYLASGDEAALLLVGENGDELYVRAAKERDTPPLTANYQVEDQAAAEVVQSQQTAILSGKDAPVSPVTGNLPGAAAYMPLVSRGRALGVLCVTARRGRDKSFTQQEAFLLSALASYAAGVIGNAQLYDQLSQKLERLRAVLKHVDLPILVVDGEGRLLLANQPACTLLGLPLDALDGQPARALIQEETVLALIERDPAGVPYTEETTFSSGEVFQATVTPLGDLGLVIVLQEVGKRD